MPATSWKASRIRIAEIQDKGLLPAGWRIVPFYDRIELISAALKTVYKALGEGILLVVVVLFVFLGDTQERLDRGGDAHRDAARDVLRDGSSSISRPI